jgi:branched-subunit amino acid transport protein AzlD
MSETFSSSSELKDVNSLNLTLSSFWFVDEDISKVDESSELNWLRDEDVSNDSTTSITSFRVMSLIAEFFDCCEIDDSKVKLSSIVVIWSFLALKFWKTNDCLNRSVFARRIFKTFVTKMLSIVQFDENNSIVSFCSRDLKTLILSLLFFSCTILNFVSNRDERWLWLDLDEWI